MLDVWRYHQHLIFIHHYLFSLRSKFHRTLQYQSDLLADVLVSRYDATLLQVYKAKHLVFSHDELSRQESTNLLFFYIRQSMVDNFEILFTGSS